MQKDVTEYFETEVIPLIEQELPDVASAMLLSVGPPFGLDIADEHSDMYATIYLENPLWKDRGGRLQLLLEESFERFGANATYCCNICVLPMSWLGEVRLFLETGAKAEEELPWETVGLETLFEVQHNLILRDPHGVYRKLREATAPDRFPRWLWKKLLIDELHGLVDELIECKQLLKGGRALEVFLYHAALLEKAVRIGFLLNEQYYPTRDSLRWAYAKLPVAADQALPHIDAAVASDDPEQRVASLEAILDTYRQHIHKKKILPSVNILAPMEAFPDSGALGLSGELVWAQRCEAWSNPNWRQWITGCEDRAKKAGHADSWWIWSLWGWK